MIDLTPLDVRKKRGDFRRGLRGYDSQEVDTFLELVAERLENLVKENLTLKERSELLSEQVASQNAREKAVQDALVTAQTLRDEIQQQAGKEAEGVREQARSEAEAAREQARREAEMLTDQAKREAKQLREQVEAEVAQMREKAAGDTELLRKETESELERLTIELERLVESKTGALDELERKRKRFLRAFRSLLERELDGVAVEEGRVASEESILELDLTGGQRRSRARMLESAALDALASNDDEEEGESGDTNIAGIALGAAAATGAATFLMDDATADVAIESAEAEAQPTFEVETDSPVELGTESSLGEDPTPGGELGAPLVDEAAAADLESSPEVAAEAVAETLEVDGGVLPTAESEPSASEIAVPEVPKLPATEVEHVDAPQADVSEAGITETLHAPAEALEPQAAQAGTPLAEAPLADPAADSTMGEVHEQEAPLLDVDLPREGYAEAAPEAEALLDAPVTVDVPVLDNVQALDDVPVMDASSDATADGGEGSGGAGLESLVDRILSEDQPAAEPELNPGPAPAVAAPSDEPVPIGTLAPESLHDTPPAEELEQSARSAVSELFNKDVPEPTAETSGAGGEGAWDRVLRGESGAEDEPAPEDGGASDPWSPNFPDGEKKSDGSSGWLRRRGSSRWR